MSTEPTRPADAGVTDSGLSTSAWLIEYDRILAEHEAREFAESIGYSFGVMTDGTFLMEPPDPYRGPVTTEPVDGDKCADCGVPLDALNRCQQVRPLSGLRFRLRFVCPEHYAAALD